MVEAWNLIVVCLKISNEVIDDLIELVCRQVVALSGYVFFGSAVQLGERMSSLAAALGASAEDAVAHYEGLFTPVKPGVNSQSALAVALEGNTDSPATKRRSKAATGAGAGGVASNAGPPGSGDSHQSADEVSSEVQRRLAITGLASEAAPAALKCAQRFLLVDLSTISGLDATAAATFKKMSMSCALKGVVMVLTGVPQPHGRPEGLRGGAEGGSGGVCLFVCGFLLLCPFSPVVTSLCNN